MSLLRKVPRQVYRVYAEDDCLADEALSPGDCTVRAIDAGIYATDGDAYDGDDAHTSDSSARAPEAAAPGGHHERPRGLTAASLAGLALLTAVMLGTGAVVVLHTSHAPTARQSVAERHVSSSAVHRVSPSVPVSAPAQLPVPHTQRNARASTSPAARPPRHRPPLARGHEEIPKTIPTYKPPSGGEFDFER